MFCCVRGVADIFAPLVPRWLPFRAINQGMTVITFHVLAFVRFLFYSPFWMYKSCSTGPGSTPTLIKQLKLWYRTRFLFLCLCPASFSTLFSMTLYCLTQQTLRRVLHKFIASGCFFTPDFQVFAMGTQLLQGPKALATLFHSSKLLRRISLAILWKV